MKRLLQKQIRRPKNLPPSSQFTQLFKKYFIVIIAFFFSVGIKAQNLTTVSGTVADSTGKPMEAVTIRTDHSKQNVLSDASGNFTIRVSPEDKNLVFIYTGMKPHSESIGGKLVYNVVLTPDVTGLSDVVVIGYGTRKKEAITGSVATVTNKDISNVFAGSQVANTLAGKLAGVTFRQPDGRPGAAATINIRNFGPALYVIDGVQSDVITFNTLVATDIESISVLKDAAAAVYGLRGANGVVLVTTRHGKNNEKPTINANYTYGLQNLFRYDKVLTNSYDYMRYKAEADINSSTSGNVYGSTTITDDELAKYKQGTDFGYQSFDWKDYIIKKNSPLINTNINATGGSDKITYYVSANNVFQNSLLGREYTYRRSNLQANVTAKIANGLKIGAEIYGSKEQTKNPGVPGGDDYFQGLFAVLRNTPLERPFANDNPKYLNHISNDESNWGYDDFEHAGVYSDQLWRVRTNLTAEYQVPFIKGLTISGFYSYYWINQLLNNHEFTYDTYTYSPVDTSYTRTGGSTNPWRERRQTNLYTVSTNIKASYNHTFGDHTIEATLVNERIDEHYIMDWVHSVPPLNSLTLIYFPQADTYTDVDNDVKRIGYIARVGYNYADKYFLDLSGRRDLSSLFPPGHRVGYFPSVAGSWRVTKENFFQNMFGSKRILSDFKLRASYGVLGQDALTVNTDVNGGGLGNYVPILNFFSYLPGYNYNVGSAIFNGQLVPGSRDKGAPITNVTWIKNQTLNFGLDFGLLNNSLSGTFDYFKRTQKGLLAPRLDLLVPSELGYTLPQENLNSQIISGYEMSLNYTGNSKKLNYRVGGNFSYARAKTDYIYKPTFNNSLDQYYSTNAEAGRYVDKTWGYICIGQFKSQDQINNYSVDIDGRGNKTLLPGDLIYKDINGDGKIDQNDTRPIGTGTGQPLFNFGLNISLTYQNFDFTASFSGAAGYTWTQQYESLWPFQNNGNLNTIFEDRWHKEDFRDPNSTWVPGKYPALRFNPGFNGSNYSTTSTFWTHNVKYFRARTIEIGYSFSQDWMKKVGASRGRIFVNSYNLFSLDNMKQYNIDPEINATSSLQYPQTRNFNFGFNLTF